MQALPTLRPDLIGRAPDSRRQRANLARRHVETRCDTLADEFYCRPNAEPHRPRIAQQCEHCKEATRRTAGAGHPQF